jgi:putative transposase
MNEQTTRKTYKFKLRPTPEQERVHDHTLLLCRHIDNAAVAERRDAWQKCSVSVGYCQQKKELPGIKAEMPADSELHSQALQEVVQRVERAFQASSVASRRGRQRAIPASTDVTATTA